LCNLKWDLHEPPARQKILDISNALADDIGFGITTPGFRKTLQQRAFVMLFILKIATDNN